MKKKYKLGVISVISFIVFLLLFLVFFPAGDSQQIPVTELPSDVQREKAAISFENDSLTPDEIIIAPRTAKNFELSNNTEKRHEIKLFLEKDGDYYMDSSTSLEAGKTWVFEIMNYEEYYGLIVSKPKSFLVSCVSCDGENPKTIISLE